MPSVFWGPSSFDTFGSAANAGVTCLPTRTACLTSGAIGTNTLWTITRVPFSDVPTASLFMSEKTAKLNYDMETATANVIPFNIGQMVLRNLTPFEQFLSARCLKRVYTIKTFRWSVGIAPTIGIAIDEIPGLEIV